MGTLLGTEAAMTAATVDISPVVGIEMSSISRPLSVESRSPSLFSVGSGWSTSTPFTPREIEDLNEMFNGSEWRYVGNAQ